MKGWIVCENACCQHFLLSTRDNKRPVAEAAWQLGGLPVEAELFYSQSSHCWIWIAEEQRFEQRVNHSACPIESSFHPLRCHRWRRLCSPRKIWCFFYFISLKFVFSFFGGETERKKNTTLFRTRVLWKRSMFSEDQMNPKCFSEGSSSLCFLKKNTKLQLSTNLNVSLSLLLSPTRWPYRRTLGLRSCWLVAEGFMGLYIYL